MLSAGRICRHHAGRKRSAPVPALAAAGRRGRFAPALFRISGASPVPTDVSCSGPGRRDGQPLPALSVIPSSRHRARRCRPSPAEIFIHTIGRGGPASRVPHTPAAPPMPDPGRWVRQPPAALSVLPLRRQRAACSLAAPAGRLDNSYPLSQNGRLPCFQPLGRRSGCFPAEPYPPPRPTMILAGVAARNTYALGVLSSENFCEVLVKWRGTPPFDLLVSSSVSGLISRCPGPASSFENGVPARCGAAWSPRRKSLVPCESTKTS